MKKTIFPALAAIVIVLTLAGCKKKTDGGFVFYPSSSADFYGTVWSGTANGSERLRLFMRNLRSLLEPLSTVLPPWWVRIL